MTDVISCPVGTDIALGSSLSLTPALDINQAVDDVQLLMSLTASDCSNFTFANSTLSPTGGGNITVTTPFDVTCTASYSLQYGDIVEEQSLEFTPSGGEVEQVVNCEDLNVVLSCETGLALRDNAFVTNSDVLTIGTAAYNTMFGLLSETIDYTELLSVVCDSLAPAMGSIGDCLDCGTGTEEPTVMASDTASDPGSDPGDNNGGSDTDDEINGEDNGEDNGDDTDNNDRGGEDTSSGFTHSLSKTLTFLTILSATVAVVMNA